MSGITSGVSNKSENIGSTLNSGLTSTITWLGKCVSRIAYAIPPEETNMASSNPQAAPNPPVQPAHAQPTPSPKSPSSIWELLLNEHRKSLLEDSQRQLNKAKIDVLLPAPKAPSSQPPKPDAAKPAKVEKQVEKATPKSFLGQCLSNLTSLFTTVTSQITLDRIGELSIAASVAIGSAVVLRNSDPTAKLEGLGIAAYGSALSCGLWGLGSILKGEKVKGGKLLLVGTTMASMVTKASQIHTRQVSSLDSSRPMAYDYSILGSIATGTSLNEENDLLKQRNDELYAELNSIENQNEKFKAEFQPLADKALKEMGALHAENLQLRSDVEDLKSRGLVDRIRNKVPNPKKPSSTTTDELPPTLDKIKEQFSSTLAKLSARRANTNYIKNGRRITFGSTYIIENNPTRTKLARLVDDNHKEYSERWGLIHRVVTDSLLKGQCTNSAAFNADCVSYWNKIAVLRNWLNEPATNLEKVEDWYILPDDDMPVTNMKIDPFAALDTLRRGKDSSVIVARDVVHWTGNEYDSVNTGLFFVRKDEASRQLFNKIWSKRNDVANPNSFLCRTLGTCLNQDVLHEQEALARVIRDERSLLDRVLTVVEPRDTYGKEELALNTFNRDGCFVRQQDGWGSDEFGYHDDPSSGKWRPGDWMGQTAGVPTWGWYCGDKKNGKPPGPVRRDKLKDMISKVVR